MLQKFTVPRGVYLIAVHPVHHKFGEQGLSFGLFDARQSQRFINRGVGFPVARNPRWLGAVMHLTGVLQPASANMFDEATVDLSWRTASLTPVEDKFCPHRFRKDDIDVCLRQNIECVLAGCPVAVKGYGSADLEGVCSRLSRFLHLSISPASQNVLPKLGSCFATVGWHKARSGAVDK